MWSDDRTALQTALVMTLLLLLVYPDKAWYVRVPVTILAVAALVVERLRLSPLLWLTGGLLLLTAALSRWSTTDNHRYLMGYWLLAIAVALLGAEPEAVLKRSARLLVGLCFLFAALWKVVSPDYMDGTFFHYALLSDKRFTLLAEWLGGVTPRMHQLNAAAISGLQNYASSLQSVRLFDGPNTRPLAIAITVWTVAVEGLLALLFLLPPRFRITWGRDFVILIFALTTYAVAPVLAFGWVLLILGFVQASEHRSFVRPAYLLVFLGLQVYAAPWPQILKTVMGRAG